MWRQTLRVRHLTYTWHETLTFIVTKLHSPYITHEIYMFHPFEIFVTANYNSNYTKSVHNTKGLNATYSKLFKNVFLSIERAHLIIL